MRENIKKHGSHVVLTSHSSQLAKKPIEFNWGAKAPEERGPVVGTISNKKNRNAIGSHGDSYTVYRLSCTLH